MILTLAGCGADTVTPPTQPKPTNAPQENPTESTEPTITSPWTKTASMPPGIPQEAKPWWILWHKRQPVLWAAAVSGRLSWPGTQPV